MTLQAFTSRFAYSSPSARDTSLRRRIGYPAAGKRRSMTYILIVCSCVSSYLFMIITITTTIIVVVVMSQSTVGLPPPVPESPSPSILLTPPRPVSVAPQEIVIKEAVWK